MRLNAPHFVARINQPLSLTVLAGGLLLVMGALELIRSRILVRIQFRERDTYPCRVRIHYPTAPLNLADMTSCGVL